MRALCLRLGTVLNQTALALHLSGAAEASGAHHENRVCTDLLAWRELETIRPAMMYWRTSTGEEVDFIIEWKNKLLAVEVKATQYPSYSDAKGLRACQKEYG